MLDYKIITMNSFKFIGFQKEFTYENAHEEIPLFWSEVFSKYANNINVGKEPQSECEKAIVDYCIGEYAVCVDDLGKDKFRYLVAGKYTGGEVPQELTVYEFPTSEWAVFDCVGPNPQTLQSVSSFVFNEWLPNNQEYQMNINANIEWYDCTSNMSNHDYHSQMWIPIKKK